MKRIIIYLGLLSIPVSCAKTPSGTADSEPVPIVFKVSEQEISVVTKAVEVTTSNNLSSIYISAFSGTENDVAWNNTVFIGNGGVFTTSKYWPSTNQDYSFYAANEAISYSDGRFTVSPSSTERDIVCGYEESSQYKGVNTITLKHIFTRIGAVNVTAKDSYQISNLTVNVVPLVPGSSTKYDIASGTWSNPVSGTPVILTTDSFPSSKNCDFLLIPGRYKFIATWTASLDGYSETFENRESQEFDLKAGSKYNLSCKVGGSASKLEFKFSIEDWTTSNISIEF